MSSPPSDRREFSRAPVSHAARLTLAGGRVVEGTLGDLAIGGARFQAACALDADLDGTLELLLDGPGSAVILRAEASTRETGLRGTAIVFRALDLEGFENLKQIVLRHAADPLQVELEFEAHLGLRRREPL